MAASPPEPLPEPLRLPRGSVRGALALALMGTFAYLLVRDIPAPAVLVNAVVVALAFYFGTRGAVQGTPTPAPGATVPWKRPRVVRGMLLLGFVGLAGWFLRSNPSLNVLPPELLQVLEVLAGYVLGLTASWIVHRRAHETAWRRRLALIFRDLSAVAVLGLTGFACYGFIAGILGAFGGRVEDALSLIITYYFGSRVLSH